MSLKPNHTYHDGRGVPVRIMGPTREHADWFYSLHGNWYDSQGRLLLYRKRLSDHTWEHYPAPSGHVSNLDLDTEQPPLLEDV